jgi:hypothetical protein
MSQENLNGGRNIIAGNVSTRQLPLAADTYYIGMLLEYQADGTVTADGGNTGDGTVTAVVAGSGVAPGDWVLTCTAAVTNGGVFKLEDPSGNVVASDITMDVGAGAATTFKIAGITFTITDGATDFAAADFFTLAIEAAGEYAALSGGTLAAVYNGTNERVLSSSGVDDCIVNGEIHADGLVDDAGAALTITEAMIAAYRDAGFYVKEA